jgi:hypothetical protein
MSLAPTRIVDEAWISGRASESRGLLSGIASDAVGHGLSPALERLANAPAMRAL